MGDATPGPAWTAAAAAQARCGGTRRSGHRPVGVGRMALD